jgi:hypothetical protein
MEILGRPEVEIAFRVDRPAAQIMARLCDVGPDGASQRVTYRPINLAHLSGHEAPRALVPGETYRARISLNACGHRFRPGHRIRLALSTSYWPVIWPSPEAATVTLDLAGCRLILPERHGDAALDPQAPGPARRFPTLAADIVREQRGESTSRVEADGTSVLETYDDFGMIRRADHGLETGHIVRQRFAIREGDPLSARHEARWRYDLGRDDWRVAIESEAVMTCDAHNFFLHRRIRALEGERTTLEKSWDETVPRGLL